MATHSSVLAWGIHKLHLTRLRILLALAKHLNHHCWIMARIDLSAPILALIQSIFNSVACVILSNCLINSSHYWPAKIAQSCPTLRPHDCSLPAPLSMGFPRQEYWSGSPFLLHGILLTQGLHLGLPGKPHHTRVKGTWPQEAP